MFPIDPTDSFHPSDSSMAPRRIAVLRANGLGDFLFATPALRALAATYPTAEITYFGQPEIVAFVADRYAYIHHAEVIPYFPTIRPAYFGKFNARDRHAEARSAARAALEFFERHQSRRFDLAIQMQGGGVQSNPFVRMLGAERTAGFRGLDVHCPLDLNLIYQLYQPEVTRYLELVQILGVAEDHVSLRMDAPERPDDLERLRLVWPAVEESNFVVIQPGVSDVRRRWPLERFVAMGQRAWLAHQKTVVLTGSLSRSDREAVRGFAEVARYPVLDLSGRLDLGAFAALLRRADLVVCNDSGTSNLAHAVGAPSIVIYWSGNAITAGHFTRATYRPVISFTDRCPRCGGDRDMAGPECRHDVSFVADARLDEALRHLDDLLCHH